MRRLIQFRAVFLFTPFYLILICLLYCFTVYNISIDQEQSIAAQIVQVVIAGDSVEVPHGLLNGQVNLWALSCKFTFLTDVIGLSPRLLLPWFLNYEELKVWLGTLICNYILLFFSFFLERISDAYLKVLDSGTYIPCIFCISTILLKVRTIAV